LSTKDLVLKKRLVGKLTEQYVSLYNIEKVVFTNVVKLRLLTSIVKINLHLLKISINVAWKVETRTGLSNYRLDRDWK